MTKVKFLIDKDSDNEVFAFFPEMPYYTGGNKVTVNNWQTMKTSYSHIGRHSACIESYANECKDASQEQRKDLVLELIGHGYDDLVIIN